MGISPRRFFIFAVDSNLSAVGRKVRLRRSTSSEEQIIDFPTTFSARADLPIYGYDYGSDIGEVLFVDNWSKLSFLSHSSIHNYPFNSTMWSGSNSDGTVYWRNCNGFTSSNSTTPVSVFFGTNLHDSDRFCQYPIKLPCVCMSQHYQVGGTITGLSSGNVVLRLTDASSATSDITLVNDGRFFFNQDFDEGAAYSVAVVSTTAPETCTMTGTPSGNVDSSSSSALTITCAQVPVILESIAVTPATKTDTFDPFNHPTNQLTATGSYDDGSTSDISSEVTWSSSSSHVTISASGLATADLATEAEITAELDGITSNAAMWYVNYAD